MMLVVVVVLEVDLEVRQFSGQISHVFCVCVHLSVCGPQHASCGGHGAGGACHLVHVSVMTFFSSLALGRFHCLLG